MSALDEIRARLDAAISVPWYELDEEFIAQAPADIGSLLAAVDGVLALHQPDAGHNPKCNCGIQTGAGATCEECRDEWPCPTAHVVTEALEADR